MQKQNIQETIIIICAVFIQEGFSVCSVWQKYSHVSSFFPFLISWKVSTPAAHRLQNNPKRDSWEFFERATVPLLYGVAGIKIGEQV